MSTVKLVGIVAFGVGVFLVGLIFMLGGNSTRSPQQIAAQQAQQQQQQQYCAGEGQIAADDVLSRDNGDE